MGEDVSARDVELTQRRLTEGLHDRRVVQEKLKRFHDDYTALEELLETMPQTLTQKVMVPFGNGVAFMPGQLKHTNEISVLLGDDLFVKRTALQARQIVARRKQYLQEKLDDVQQQFQDLKAKLGFTGEFNNNNLNEEGEEFVEIREEYHSDSDEDERMGTVIPLKVGEGDNRILSLLDDLEKKEKELGEDDEDGDHTGGSAISTPGDLTSVFTPPLSSKPTSSSSSFSSTRSTNNIPTAGKKISLPTTTTVTTPKNTLATPTTTTKPSSPNLTATPSAFTGMIIEKGVDNTSSSSSSSSQPKAPDPPRKVSLFEQSFGMKRKK